MNSQIAVAEKTQNVVVEEINRYVSMLNAYAKDSARDSRKIAVASDELADLGAGRRETLKIFKI